MVRSTHREVSWRRSGQCEGGQCVEVAYLPDGTVAVRDSEDPDGPVLTFDHESWTAFVHAVRGGEVAA
jgi:hypothetical protein